jgi:hypothetical protein
MTSKSRTSEEANIPATLTPVGLRRLARRSGIRGSCNWSWSAAGDSKPLKNLIGLDLNVVVYASCTDGLEVRSVNAPSPIGQGPVRVNLGRSPGITKYIGPLFNSLRKVVIIEGSIADMVA